MSITDLEFPVIDIQEVTGVVLCGGSGARLGGQDKPLIVVESKRIIDYILEQLIPQVGRVLISCSRNVALYEALGHDVVVDREPSRGPLAGIVAAMRLVKTKWMLTIPGDVPFLASTLVNRLSIDAEQQGVAVPLVAGQRENLFLLFDLEHRRDLAKFYADGGIAAKYWLEQHTVQPTDLTDLAPSFLNVNTPANITEMQQRIVLGA